MQPLSAISPFLIKHRTVFEQKIFSHMSYSPVFISIQPNQMVFLIFYYWLSVMTMVSNRTESPVINTGIAM